MSRLVAAFDQVVAHKAPYLLTLEAPVGWGKTRLVQELYAALARERQDTLGYWPSSLHEAGGDASNTLATSPELRRKRIHPERFAPPAEATPRWFWWGISATGRSSGRAAQTLLDDVAQVEAHAEALERRWRQVSAARTD